MNRKGIPAIGLDADTVKSDTSLWHKVEAGEFMAVYATPEALLEERGHFQTKTLRDHNSVFMKNLVALVIDECHVIWDWRSFRVLYRLIGSLRLCLRGVPVIAMSATVTPNVSAYVHQAARMQYPTTRYNLSSYRDNINIITAPLDGDGVEPLRKLIPTSVTQLEDIPKTIIFHDRVDPAIAIADRLAADLPRTVGGISRDRLVTCYYGSLDKKIKSKLLREFRRGCTRIIICTDAFGLGVNIPDIQRVIQWHVDEKFTIHAAHQRLGRGARSPEVEAVGVIYVKRAVLSDVPLTAWEDAWNENDPPDEEPDDWDVDADGLRVIPVSKQRNLELFGLPVREDTIAYVSSHVRQLYSEAKTFHDAIDQAKSEIKGSNQKRVPMAKKLDPAVLWLLATQGCRHRVFSVMFDDPDVFEARHRYWCCDNCAVASGLVLSDIKVAGISPNISFACTEPPSDPAPPAVPPADPTPTRLETIGPERIRILRQRLLLGREFECKQLQIPDILPEMIFSDDVVQKVCSQVRYIVDENALRTVLKSAGLRLKFSLLSDSAVSRIIRIINFVMSMPIAARPPTAERTTVTPTLISNGIQDILTLTIAALREPLRSLPSGAVNRNPSRASDSHPPRASVSRIPRRIGSSQPSDVSNTENERPALRSPVPETPQLAKRLIDAFDAFNATRIEQKKRPLKRIRRLDDE
jgi:hypothetical protein